MEKLLTSKYKIALPSSKNENNLRKEKTYFPDHPAGDCDSSHVTKPRQDCQSQTGFQVERTLF